MAAEPAPEPTTYEMSPEDQCRVARLYEEIAERLEELALIGARLMRLRRPNGQVLTSTSAPTGVYGQILAAAVSGISTHPLDCGKP
jgi:hypothetical protein